MYVMRLPSGSRAIRRIKLMRLSAVQTHHPNVKLDEALERAEQMLEQTFGMALRNTVTKKGDATSTFVLVNKHARKLQECLRALEYYPPKIEEKGLLGLVLSIVAIAENKMSEGTKEAPLVEQGINSIDDLVVILKKFGLDVRSRHDTFGYVPDLFEEWVKQSYLEKTKAVTVGESVTYSWGTRAACEYPVSRLSRFIAKVRLVFQSTSQIDAVDVWYV